MDITEIIIQIVTGLAASSWGPYVIAFLTILGALVTIASVIAPFTKTTKDDELVAKAKAILQRFSVLKPKEDKTQ